MEKQPLAPVVMVNGHNYHVTRGISSVCAGLKTHTQATTQSFQQLVPTDSLTTAAAAAAAVAAAALAAAAAVAAAAAAARSRSKRCAPTRTQWQRRKDKRYQEHDGSVQSACKCKCKRKCNHTSWDCHGVLLLLLPWHAGPLLRRDCAPPTDDCTPRNAHHSTRRKSAPRPHAPHHRRG